MDRELLNYLVKLGREIEVSQEEAEAYLPDISNESPMRNFYIPKASKGFYDGAFKNLRELSIPRLPRC